MAEEWRAIPGHPDYDVSDRGRVSSRKSGSARIVTGAVDSAGYRRYLLRTGGRQSSHYAHVLVAAAFIGPRPPGLDVRHLDDDKANNGVGNLRYGTRSENILDAVRNGTWAATKRTHCPSGHPYDDVNTCIKRSGWRGCRACARAYSRQSRATQRAMGNV